MSIKKQMLNAFSPSELRQKFQNHENTYTILFIFLSDNESFPNIEDLWKEIYFLMKEDKIDLADRINRAKLETILWIVGVGVIQFPLGFLSKHI